MMVYIVQMGIILLLGAIVKPRESVKARRLYLVLVGVVIASVSALRHYSVGIDTLQYYAAYERSSFEGSRYGLGFISLLQFLNVFSSDPQLLIIVSSVFITYCVMRLIDRVECNAIIASFLYISLLTYATNMNLMRQALALSCILLVVPSLMKGRRAPFIMGCLIGMTFHTSAIVMLILLPLSSFESSKRTIGAYCLVALVASAVPNVIWNFVDSVFDQYSTYSTSQWAGGNTLAAPIMTAMDILLFGISHYLVANNENIDDNQKRVLFHGSMLQIVFQFLACFINIFQRMTTFTSLFLSLYVALAFNRIDNKGKFLLALSIYCGTFLFFIVIMTFRPEWHGVVPYRFFS